MWCNVDRVDDESQQEGCRERGGEVDGRSRGADDDGQDADHHRIDHGCGEDERGVSRGPHTGLSHADENRYGRVGAKRRDESHSYAFERGPPGRPAHPPPDRRVAEPALQQRHGQCDDQEERDHLRDQQRRPRQRGHGVSKPIIRAAASGNSCKQSRLTVTSVRVPSARKWTNRSAARVRRW